MKDPHTIVQELVITEKGTILNERGNQYLFRVALTANKIEIKRAVEQLFSVHVKKVNTMHRAGKKKRERTQNFGRTARSKRAVVTLQDGETIDLT